MIDLFSSRAALAVLVLAVAGCAGKVGDPEPAPAPGADEAAAREPAEASYDPETLSDLLIAEVAAQRSLYDVTLGYYAREARKTGDPQVAEQAARLAHYLEDPVLSAEMAELWLEGSNQAEGDRAARELLALSYLDQGETERATAIIDELMAENPNEALARLVLQAQTLDQESNTRLLAALGALTGRYPDQPALWYFQALSLDAEQRYEAALTAVNRALKLRPDHLDSRILKARLLYELDQPRAAFRLLERVIEKAPEARRAHVLHVRLLIQEKRIDEVAEQLRRLDELFPDDQDLRLTLALLAMESGERQVAPLILQDLLEQGWRTDEIHMFLAHASEQAGEPRPAVRHYLAVGGPNSLQARVQAARLMYQLGKSDDAAALMVDLRDRHPDQMPALYAAEAEMLSRARNPDEALDLLDRALSDLPENTELLYARAMTAERSGNLAQLEADLTRILEIKPGDATALNALGYTLADRTDRLDEAEGYIRAAYEQRPTDPAIMDSMGWVLYRQGQPDEALPYLQEAWDRMPDQEVAAHLGEVLWVLGQQDEARRIWREGLEQSPDSKAIPATVLRLTGSPAP